MYPLFVEKPRDVVSDKR